MPNKKNNYQAPILTDGRVQYVPVGCGKCIECKKQKARAWSIRLQEELKIDQNCIFITLTYSNEEYTKLYNECNGDSYIKDNNIAKLSIRRFLERYRKKHKKSIKHFLITELGHNGTENIHLHGLLWCTKEDIDNHWKYGYTFTGTYVNVKTINYMMKYVMKLDDKHPNYNQRILVSPGLGKNYLNSNNAIKNQYNENENNNNYRSDNGNKMNLPTYYKNNIYTDEEKEKLWIKLLDKNERYVLGKKIDISKNMDEYYNALKEAQKINNQLGFGDDKIDWSKKLYENSQRRLKQKARLKQ